MEHKLTVITTTYNQKNFIKDALDGIVRQKTKFPFIAVVCDDCSTDGTPEILAKYAKKYPKIIKPIYNKKNKGAMDNFIQTLSKANSEYVALCDGDDYWVDEHKLQKQVDFLDSHKEYTICFHKTKIFFEDNSDKERIFPEKLKETSMFADLIKESYIPANTVVYRWAFWNTPVKIKDTFPKNIVPGDYFVHLIHAKNGKIGFINEVMSHYRRHDQGMWWLTSQVGREDEFLLKYGLKYLNFFVAVEGYFKLNKNTYRFIKGYLMEKLIWLYLDRGFFDELFKLRELHKVLFDSVAKNISYNKFVYEKLSKPRRVFFLIATNPKEIKHKMKRKIKSFWSSYIKKGGKNE